jgi:RNA polymerase sigma factor (sigma-70 family)
MVRLSALVLGRSAVAEEIVQDVFIEMSRRWRQIESPAAYLRTAVVNRSRTEARRQRREQPRSAPPDGPLLEDEARLGDLQPLWQAITRLSARRRAVVVLSYTRGCRLARSLRSLSCKPATVRSLRHRALTQLEQVL